MGKGNGAGMRRTFERFDADGNGHLNEEEFAQVMEELAVLAGTPAPSPQHVKLAFSLIDDDSSGNISYEEFKAWWRQLKEDEENKELLEALKFAQIAEEESEKEALFEASALFKYYDKDKSGQLDPSELLVLLKELFVAMGFDPEEATEDTVKELVKSVDVDGDGQVSFDEFAQWWKAVYAQQVAAASSAE